MSCLSHLPTELKLSIIAYLEPTRSVHKPSSSRQQRRKQTGFTGTAPLQHLVNLGSVNREFRVLVAPYLFQQITLVNTQGSGESIQSIAQGPHASLVKTVHYAPLIDNLLPFSFGVEDWPATDVKEDQFPVTVVRNILGDLSRFDRLERLTVEFVITDERVNGLGAIMNLFAMPGDGDPETEEQTRCAEEKEAWRALMTNSYEAIARNGVDVVKVLDIRNVIPKEVSFWSNSAWHEFLGGIEGFTLTLRGGENGLGGRMPIMGEFSKLVERLPVYFFNHLENVRGFRFETTSEGAIGRRGASRHTFYLKGTDMPRLKCLELSFVFLNQQLLEEICQHKDTLETIRISDCVALDTSECIDRLKNYDEISWAEFFDGIRAANMIYLKEFTVSWIDMPEVLFDWEECFQVYDDEEVGKRAFVYGVLSISYGELFLADEQIRDQFEEGNDSKAWNELQAFIANNHAKPTRTA